MKKTLTYLMSGALALGIFNPGQTRAAAAAMAQRRGVAAAVRFAPRQMKEANRKLRYTITAKYPQALGARDQRLEGLNRTIRSMVTEQVNGFKKDFEAPEERMGTAGSYFEIEYAVQTANTDLVSIIFYVNSYYEGAAHPNHNAFALNYWLDTGKTLALADLFKSNSNHLDAISNYSIRTLKRKLTETGMTDDDWMRNGAGPKEENFKNWNITRRGLMITFEPYQVAAYAAGEHEVLIPYSALRSIIDPQGPLGKMR